MDTILPLEIWLVITRMDAATYWVAVRVCRCLGPKSPTELDQLMDKFTRPVKYSWPRSIKFCLPNGKVHRGGDLPAVTYADGTQRWYRNGQLYRDGDLPAIIYADGARRWYRDGQLHRDGDLPAKIYANGTRRWYCHGQLHRDGDLPAAIYADGTQRWYCHGKQYLPL